MTKMELTNIARDVGRPLEMSSISSPVIAGALDIAQLYCMVERWQGDISRGSAEVS